MTMWVCCMFDIFDSRADSLILLRIFSTTAEALKWPSFLPGCNIKFLHSGSVTSNITMRKAYYQLHVMRVFFYPSFVWIKKPYGFMSDANKIIQSLWRVRASISINLWNITKYTAHVKLSEINTICDIFSVSMWKKSVNDGRPIARYSVVGVLLVLDRHGLLSVLYYTLLQIVAILLPV